MPKIHRRRDERNDCAAYAAFGGYAGFNLRRGRRRRAKYDDR